jgi:HEAT repeat protein
MRTGRSFILLLAVGIGAFARWSAAGAPVKSAKPAASQPASPAFAAIATKLRSTAPDEVSAGLAEARSLGKAGVSLAPAIEELLGRGVPAELAKEALQTLGDLGGPTASNAIVPYARHRHPDVRRAAIKALLKTGGPDAVAALRAALSDPDGAVRGLAAAGLGNLGAKPALADLFTALDHRIDEAAAAIGQICAPEECERLAAKTGVVPFDVMTSGFEQILFRPAAEIPDDEKLKVIGRIRELGTPDANKYLRDVQSRWPQAGSVRIKQAVAQAIAATGGSGAGPQPGSAAAKEEN